MVLSEYEAKRHDLDAEMEKLNTMESEKKMELSIKYQQKLKAIQGKMNQLKKERQEALKNYQNDKAWWHAKFRDEKHNVSAKIHMLRLEYLTVNGIDCKETRQVGNGGITTGEQHETTE